MGYRDSPEGCREYKRKQQRKWYRANRERARASHRERQRRYVARNRALVLAAKSSPCVDCGGTFPAAVMEFHHVRGTKIADVSRLAAQAVAVVRLLAEIAKCDLLCANCHRLRHV